MFDKKKEEGWKIKSDLTSVNSFEQIKHALQDIVFNNEDCKQVPGRKHTSFAPCPSNFTMQILVIINTYRSNG